MGGSATEIATIAGWENPGQRITGHGAWSWPGEYPAEWLHRSALSWGNIQDVLYPQSSYNLIFGSSEANSLMTQYGKSWQLLFAKEFGLQRELRQRYGIPLEEYQALLMTTSTPDDGNVVSTSLGHDDTM
jgi:hypothetical protein